MTVMDFLELSSYCPLNLIKLEAFQNYYGVTFSEEAEGCFCALPDGEFLTTNSNRFAHVLDSDSILFSEELICKDFGKKNLLPLIDLGDGVYVCYIGKEQVWGCYSLADRCLFCIAATLPELLSEIAL
jgi:hypothetical protein